MMQTLSIRSILPCLVIGLIGHVLPLEASLGDSINRKRSTALIIGIPTVHAASIVLFDQLWYRNQPREGFHFFNDGPEWKQVDKVGHSYSAFHLSSGLSRSFQWAGYSDRKSDLIGSVVSILFMSSIEIMDGFSSEFGASGWDLVSDVSGIGLYMGQKILWNEVRITPKYSYYPTSFPEKRPNVLGSNFAQQLFKDYNGQTYWLSFDINSFVREGNHFPSWLNIAVGYGAYNMFYANNDQNIIAGYDPFRQFYLSLDLDLSHFRSRSSIINSVLFFVNMIRIPAPGIEFNKKDKIKFRLLTF